MRKQTVPENSTLTYLLGDHLGSTSLAVDASTGGVIETRYKPWGEVRYSTPDATLPTRYSYTGQYSHMSDEVTDLGNVGFGLMFYNARWYDPSLSRFAQADTIIPAEQGVQALDRYAYANNSPINYRDSSGHSIECAVSGSCHDIIVLSGWSDSYLRMQPDNYTCASAAVASGLSVMLRREISTDFVTTAYRAWGSGRLGQPAKLTDNLGVLPGDQASAINGMHLGITAIASYGNNRQNLIDNLEKGLATLVTVSWYEPNTPLLDKAFAHVLLVQSYSPSTGEFTFMDPRDGTLITEAQFQDSKHYGVTFDQAWLYQPHKGTKDDAYISIPSGSMVTLRQDSFGIISGGGGGRNPTVRFY